MSRLTEKMQRLLEFLRQVEIEGRRISPDELERRAIAATQYKELKTYRSKYLDDKLIFEESDGTVYVRGAVGIAPEAFAELLSQTKSASIKTPEYATQEEWIAAISSLAHLGQACRFRIPAEERLVFYELLED